MNNRLIQIIDYKTSGNRRSFASLMGWSPQYLSRLIQGECGIGMNPAVTILNALPEINARWFLTGAGEMLTTNPVEYVQSLLSLEKYLPFMSPQETEQLASGNVRFSLEQINEWDKRLEERRAFLADVFSKAYERQNNTKLCNTQTAN